MHQVEAWNRIVPNSQTHFFAAILIVLSEGFEVKI